MKTGHITPPEPNAAPNQHRPDGHELPETA